VEKRRRRDDLTLRRVIVGSDIDGVGCGVDREHCSQESEKTKPQKKEEMS
jgi:hypothetical protein